MQGRLSKTLKTFPKIKKIAGIIIGKDWKNTEKTGFPKQANNKEILYPEEDWYYWQ